MFTRCPECATVFRLGAEELRTASGQVRCGDCGTVFQAIDHLQDHPEATPAGVTGAEESAPWPRIGDLFDPPATVEPVPELEAEAAGQDDAPDDELRPTDDPLRRVPRWDEDEGISVDEVDTGASEVRLEETGDDGITDDDHAERPDEDTGTDATTTPRTGLDWNRFDTEPTPTYRRWPWAIGAVVALLAGTALGVHHFRQDLMLVEPVAPWLEKLYGAVEQPVAPPPAPRAIRVSRAEMVSHPTLPGALVLTATLTNEAAYPQSLPVVRLTMEDRWGEVLAGRDFGPSDWVRGGRRLDRPLEPGERVAASIEVADPSPDAVGFQITVCLDTPQGLRCADEG